MRQAERAAIILTGATGFLGGHLMAALLERGDRVVVLGRASEGRSLADRIAGHLAWFGLSARGDQVETAEADLRQPRCGLAEDRYRALCARAGPVVHCASDTRFSERRRQEITETNVHGLRRILDLAADSRTPFFHYVSTAYVAGKTSGRCPEELVACGDFANVYEETKAHAEREVAARCQRDGLPYSIIRPSIVYGDSRSGRSTRFNALYHPVKSLAILREIYLNDLASQGGEKARACGIALERGGVLRLPLRVFVGRRGHLNLIPIDYFVSAVECILERAEAGAIYHLTSDSPITLGDLAGYCQSFLKIAGIEIIEGSSGETPLNPPEALFQKFLEPYLPYLADARSFDRRHANRATCGLKPPEFSYDIFERCMSYAISVSWGVDRGSYRAA
ncbi:MAG: SDR family oxidoreductase [Candidatus Latescibacterota bacterium]|jgi:nucleoside-diphosphate-sugar epimerase